MAEAGLCEKELSRSDDMMLCNEALKPKSIGRKQETCLRAPIIKAQTKGVAVSLFVHGVAVAGLILSGGLAQPKNQPLVIDFTLTEPEPPAQTVFTPKATAVMKQAEPVRQKRVPVSSNPKPVVQKKASELPAVVPSPAAPEPAASVFQSGFRSEPTEAGTAVSHLSQGGGVGKAESADAGNSPAGDHGEGAAAAKKRYQKEHFAYIRDLIIKNLSYPLLARKMGWEGRVVLSFVVCEDGSVEKVAVQESSGRSILDKKAVETIRKVCPLPKPPVKAELVMPIVYELR